MILAGITRFYVCKSSWTWHAWNNFGCTSRHNPGKDFWWQWKENPVHRVPPDNATGKMFSAGPTEIIDYVYVRNILAWLLFGAGFHVYSRWNLFVQHG